MADQEDLEYTYSLIDKIFRFSFGDTGDFSGAMYNGDFTQSLEEAQRRKHQYIADSLNIRMGSRVLDMGCGWGPFLTFVRELGASGVGLTLSTRQFLSCRRNGLDVHLQDCRRIEPETFGTFDAVSCIGAFEAFCSKEEWEDGKQEEVYCAFFDTASGVLPVGGRLFVQTMTFGKNMIDGAEVDVNAKKYSDAHVLGLMARQFPGSWLPYGQDQVIENAKPRFKLVSSNNGRLDYIETQKQWSKNWRRFDIRKYLLYLSMLPGYVVSADLRNRIQLLGVPANRICFERELLDHFRLVFEKVDA